MRTVIEGAGWGEARDHMGLKAKLRAKTSHRRQWRDTLRAVLEHCWAHWPVESWKMGSFRERATGD